MTAPADGNYVHIRDGINAVLATVGDLTTATVLAYEPYSQHCQILMYTTPLDGELGSTKVRGTASVGAWVYRMRHRLCVPWQDRENADEVLAPYIDAIPAAINDDPWLGTTYPGHMAADGVTPAPLSGGTFITSFQAHEDLMQFGRDESGPWYRYVDFFSESTVKSVG